MQDSFAFLILGVGRLREDQFIDVVKEDNIFEKLKLWLDLIAVELFFDWVITCRGLMAALKSSPPPNNDTLSQYCLILKSFN